jgi:hypothetical protein
LHPRRTISFGTEGSCALPEPPDKRWRAGLQGSGHEPSPSALPFWRLGFGPPNCSHFHGFMACITSLAQKIKSQPRFFLHLSGYTHAYSRHTTHTTHVQTNLQLHLDPKTASFLRSPKFSDFVSDGHVTIPLWLHT